MKRFNDWTDGNKLKKILICLTDSAEVEKLKEIKFMCIEKDIQWIEASSPDEA